MKDLNLDEVIVGRVEPHIYAFTTNTIPNYLKVGDTYRTVKSRLEEWKKHFPNLKPKFEGSAKISDDVFFRDFAVHDYLEKGLHRERLTRAVLKDMRSKAYFSKEFFKNATTKDIRAALRDIQKSYADNDNRYSFYNLDRMPVLHEYRSTGYWKPRPNQKATIKNFMAAIKKGRTNLLMYAVMRFGKSFTSLCCAKEMKAKIVLVVSAKADVKEEWRKNVQSADNFRDDYKFLDADSLAADEKIIKDTLRDGKGVVLFLTLQDLQGEDIKSKHKEVFDNKIDLLIVDETHYGARAEKYGAVLQQTTVEKKDYFAEEIVDEEEIDKQTKSLNAKITLHLSGTPYRILMGSEFTKEDIIAFYQFSDIVKEQEDWDRKNILKDDADPEWANPYFGFPQMIRFAFHPSAAAKAKLDELRKNGVSYAFSELFKPKSISRADDDSHKLFVHEAEILDLFKVIDGSRNDKNVLGFLNLEKIKKGNMCRHIVCVLPYCASCDALEKLIRDNKKKFKNLNEYEIINISGVDSSGNYKDVNAVKEKIKKCEDNNKKTLTLTVNRMLTGSTVEEWDTMIFLKDTASPQDYDQAVFRLQNQYVRKYKDPESKQEIKYNMKPQTLLVDFNPDRMFMMQEAKSQIYNLNIDVKGNSKLQDRIAEELRVSPIITINQDKIRQVEATDIIAAISEYSSKRGILEETNSIPVDFELLRNKQIREVINRQAEIGSNKGLKIDGNAGEETDFNLLLDGKENDTKDTKLKQNTDDKKQDEIRIWDKKFKTYYSRILFFAFLTDDKISSLDDILCCISKTDNIRIARNLELDKPILKIIRKQINAWVLQSLDYNIYKSNKLANDVKVDPIKRAETALIKFGRFSESEVPTPINVCIDMVDLIPDCAFLALRKKNNTMLDIASKAGEFAIAICKRCEKLGIKIETIKDSVLAIPTSSIAYEFTRKVYKFLGLNIDTIATEFNSYDLLKIKMLDRHGKQTKDIDYKKVAAVLKQTKPLDKIKLNDNIEEAGENKMQFQAVVGNPPYQISDGGGTGSSALPIYNNFVDVSKNLVPSYISMIIPSRWMLGGKGLDDFRANMINDLHIRVMHDYLDSKFCFSQVSVEGGVCYFLIDCDNTGKCLFVSHSESGLNKKLRLLSDGDPEVIVRSIDAVPIVKKTKDKRGVFSSIVSTRNLFKVNESKLIKTKKPIEVFGRFNNKRDIRYLASYATNDSRARSFLGKYKVFVSKADGAAGFLGNPMPARVIGVPEFGDKNTICTETFLAVGPFDTKDEAKAVIKYMSTRFFRFLVGARKLKNMTQETYSFVPMQDFSKKSSIQWSKPVDDIDKQLFKLYKLTKKEIKIITEMIEPME